MVDGKDGGQGKLGVTWERAGVGGCSVGWIWGQRSVSRRGRCQRSCHQFGGCATPLCPAVLPPNPISLSLLQGAPALACCKRHQPPRGDQASGTRPPHNFSGILVFYFYRSSEGTGRGAGPWRRDRGSSQPPWTHSEVPSSVEQRPSRSGQGQRDFVCVHH